MFKFTKPKTQIKKMYMLYSEIKAILMVSLFIAIIYSSQLTKQHLCNIEYANLMILTSAQYLKKTTYLACHKPGIGSKGGDGDPCGNNFVNFVVLE